MTTVLILVMAMNFDKSFIAILLLIALCSCGNYCGKQLLTTASLISNTEVNRITLLKARYLSNQLINADVWEDKKLRDSIYVKNQPVTQEYKTILFSYNIGINSYPRLTTIDSIINHSDFNEGDTLFLLERINCNYPKDVKVAFWKDINHIFYTKKSEERSLNGFCLDFMYQAANSGKTQEGESFDMWKEEMLKNPFNPIWSKNNVYLFTSIKKNNKKLIVIESLMFIN